MALFTLRLCSTVMAAATVAAVASSAHAEPPAAEPPASARSPSGPPSAQGTESSNGVADIIVTAQRRPQTAQRAGIAITAVSSDALARAGVEDVTQLARLAPALQIGTFGGTNTQIFLRGVGNFTSNILSDSAVSVNLDGVPLANSSAIQGMFFDLERVEVLKGPQGTLYGRNATGGAINIITAKPELRSSGGYIDLEYGNYDAARVNSAINVPIGDYTALRVAGTFSNQSGTFSDGTGDDKSHAVRVQLRSEPSDGIKLLVGGDYSHFGGKGQGQTYFGLDPDARIGTTDPRAGAYRSQFFAPVGGAFLTPLPNDAAQNNTYWGVFAQADVKTPIGTVTVLPSYRKTQIHETSEALFTTFDRLKDDQYSLEARLASNGDRGLTYLIGGFFLRESVHQKVAFDQDVFNSYPEYFTKTTSYAAFGTLTYHITDAFRLTGGLRYTQDDKSALLTSFRIISVCRAPGGLCLGTPPLPRTATIPSNFLRADGSPVPAQLYGTAGALAVASVNVNDVSKDFKKLTYRAGFEWDAGRRSLIYGTFETGFKSGGFFNSIDNPVYQPENISAFTIGSKNRFFGNRLQLNLEAYWWIYRNQQVSHNRLNSAGGSEFITENIGKTRIRGVELETVARLAENTNVNAIVQYVDAKRLKYTYQSPLSGGPPITGCPVTLVGTIYTVDCDNTRAVNAPEWSVNAGIQQFVPLRRGGRLSLNADMHYQSWYYSGIEQLAAQRESGYATLNAQLGYEAPGGHFMVAAFVNNITDKNVVTFSARHPFAPGLIVQSLNSPRMYGVRVGYKF